MGKKDDNRHGNRSNGRENRSGNRSNHEKRNGSSEDDRQIRSSIVDRDRGNNRNSGNGRSIDSRGIGNGRSIGSRGIGDSRSIDNKGSSNSRNIDSRGIGNSRSNDSRNSNKSRRSGSNRSRDNDRARGNGNFRTVNGRSSADGSNRNSNHRRSGSGNNNSGRNSNRRNDNTRIIQMRARKGEKKKEAKNKFLIRMQKKLAVLYIMVLLAFSGLVFRLAWITREDGARYQKQVLSQQKYESTTLPFRRGDIVDAKGTRLATSEKVYNLVIDAKVMTTEVKGEQVYLESTLQALGEHFKQLDMNAIREYVTTHRNSSYYVPLKQLTYEEISGFQEAMQNSGKSTTQTTKQATNQTGNKGTGQTGDGGTQTGDDGTGQTGDDGTGKAEDDGTGQAGDDGTGQAGTDGTGQAGNNGTGQGGSGGVNQGGNETQTKSAIIKGVWFEEEYRRIYPYNSLAADVIGFASKDNIGSYGLEEYYNDVLNGVNGREYGYLNDDQALERTLKSAVDGYNIHSTIDANLQMIVEKYLKKFDEEHQNEYIRANGAENTACIMMDINSGEILAMAEYPGYNLNDTRNPESLLGTRMVEMVTNANGYQELKKTDTYITEEVLANMSSDELYLNLNNLWKCFCITGTYEPGSTAKPFTVAAALEEGAIKATDTFECNSLVEVGGYKMGCHNRVDGILTLEQAVAKSCNVAMIKISQRLGNEAFCKFQQIFNFGLRTNIDLAGEARTASFVYSANEMGPTDLATNSFGQNFNVTMIEMITGFCSLINGGNYYEPHVVNKITNANGATITNIEPRVLKQTVSASTSEMIRKCCEAVVEYGTGKPARPAGYAIGGKTGTAETIDPNTHERSKTEYVVSFIGYAPADDPQIAIYVVVDRPNVPKQSSSTYATGIVRNILTEALPYLNIFMTEPLSEEEKEELEALQMEITSQYGRPSAGDDDGQGGDQGEGQGDNQTPADIDMTSTGMSFPIDPETGFRVDPETGERYDPETGFAIDGGESVPDATLPLNPNL